MATGNRRLSTPSIGVGETGPHRFRLLFGNLLKARHGSFLIRRLDETIAAFLAQYDNLDTQRAYEKALHPFAEVVGTNRALDSITPEMLDVWHQYLRKCTLADATIANRTKKVKVFWNWCVRREYVTQSPARFLVVKQCKRALVSKAIPGDVLAAMFDAVQHKSCDFLAARDTAILALLITFGARVGDVARLALSDIYLEGNRIVFHVKGGKEHLLPLPHQTRQHLATWLSVRSHYEPDPAHGYVFVNNRTRLGHRHAPLAVSSISTMIRRLSSQVCERTYGPHSIRHWRGQSLADHRIAPTIVQTILGHSDVRITLEHYYNQDLARVEGVLETYELGNAMVNT